MFEVLSDGHASAALAASIFHYEQYSIPEVKTYLAALGVVDVSRWSVHVEQAIALSIAYVAADTVFHPGSDRSRWPETFLFGLVHGLGFAGFLAQSLVMERAKGTALFAFNLGVEAGQLVIVILLASALRFWPQCRVITS